MPAILRDDIWDDDRLQRYLRSCLTLSDPLYRPAMSVIRRCHTMTGATGMAMRIRKLLRDLHAGGVDPLHATRDDLEDWLAGMARLSPETIDGYLGAARVLYDEAIERDLISKNPTRRLRVGKRAAPKVPAFSLMEASRLLRSIRSEISDPKLGLVAARDYFIMCLALTLGPRASEILRLTVGDMRLDSDPPVAEFYAKGRHHALKRVPVLAAEAYATYIKELQGALGRDLRPDDALAVPMSSVALLALRNDPDRPLRPMARPALYNMVRNRLDAVGISGAKVGSHRLRKTAATLMWQAHVDAETIRSTLNHADVSVTFRNYISPAEDLSVAPGDLLAFDLDQEIGA